MLDELEERRVTAAGRLEPLDWQTYLDDEERSPFKREYVYGRVYAMAGAKLRHNLIVGNLLFAIRRRLQSASCQVFASDLKIRIQTAKGVRFYYPDCSVVCGADDQDVVYVDNPVVVAEVSSPSTRRIDEGEKMEGYLSISSLTAYLLVDSERHGVVVWRRQGDQFVAETYADLSAPIPLPEIGVTLPLAEVYANVEWPPAPTEEMDT